MPTLVDFPLIVSLANWVWGGEKSEVAPEFCLNDFNFLFNGACFSGLLVKGIGIAIIAAACLNKAPVMLNIINSKSAAGFTQFSVYSDALVVSNCAFYGLLNGQPITAFGENVSLSIQCIMIALLMWKYKDDPEVTTQQKVVAAVSYIAYVIYVTVFLDAEYYYLLMASVLPMALLSRGSQVLEAFRLKHMGSNALLTHCMNFLGSSIRIITTIKEIGWDWAVLSGYVLSVVINGIIIIQFIVYRENTDAFLREQEKKKQE
jgi:mannose-P-dolichol utilization defect protein 1